MKNLIIATILIISGTFAASAQSHQNHTEHNNEHNNGHNRRHVEQHVVVRPNVRVNNRVVVRPNINRRLYRMDNNILVRNEYRYVKTGELIFKETYRTTYTRSGIVVNRVLIRRESISLDDYNRHRSSFRFNIYIPF